MKGNFVNGKEEGVWKFFHDNNNIKFIGNFKKGTKDGKWEEYKYNGELIKKGKYKDGKKEGVWEFYNTKGQLTSKEYYKSGMLELDKTITSSSVEKKKGVFYSKLTGRLFDGDFSYKIGNIETKGKIKQGRKSGEWITSYIFNGNLVRIQYY